jgi:hypothetical protein
VQVAIQLSYLTSENRKERLDVNILVPEFPQDDSDPLITLGVAVQAGLPVAISRSFLSGGHMQVRGITGAGKTSRGLFPIILQLLKANRSAPRAGGDPIVVFDLAGDHALFNSVRAAAEATKHTFRFFSLGQDHASQYFPPFQAAEPGDNGDRIAELLIEAFNLEHGSSYGKQYFTGQNFRALLSVADHLVQSGIPGQSVTMNKIAEYLESNKKKIRDADEIRVVFEFLKRISLLNPELAESHDKVIDLARAIDQGEVIYFYMPVLGQAISARPIVGLALHSLLRAATRRVEQSKPKKHCWVFVDEFQTVAGRSFQNYMFQCRKFGISLILSHHDNQQLRDRDTALDTIIDSQTAVKMLFSFVGDEIEELQRRSKTSHQRLKTYTRSWSSGSSIGMASSHSENFGPNGATSGFNMGNSSGTFASSGESISEREEILPIIDLNQIHDVSGTEGQFFLVINGKHGHIQPTAVQGEYAIPADTFHKFNQMALPKCEPRAPLSLPTVVALQLTAAQPGSKAPIGRADPMSKHHKELLAAFAEVEERLLWRHLSIDPEKTTDP